MLRMKEKGIIGIKSILQSVDRWTSEYYKYIIVFGILFLILQISDLTTTLQALKNSEIKELNPFYDQIWFVPFKLTAVFFIMIGMYYIPEHNRSIAKKEMLGMIYMYVIINLNNLYLAMQ